MIYALFIAFCALVFAAVAVLAFKEWLADKWADYQDGARDAVSAPDALRGVPESTLFDPKPDVVRARLASVPVQPLRHLRSVRDDAMTDVEWARLMAAVIPEQRTAGEGS